ncbi:CobW family GTP-binding protein [Pseudodesulfovibrio senegalensis]|uniref:GTP-binding protein n=1 Tax=Pseudodesulfovibrio senegalensis TaxID=1721087 RepID=A0A6N6N188_9BACT|nr:GTP-binding protein [Pseudodesulfovibrio senegalensis]KAB1440269.1 GTP-binding protein [Pseudodesulfovibrio senegalensis]
MNLSAILPVQRRKDHPVNMPDLLMNCVLAASQHDTFKRLVGWKGMSVCARGLQGWTAKLKTRPGVYGLCTAQNHKDESGHHADIGLYYFPSPDEELLETMSLAANHAAVQDDYLDSVRTFSGNRGWAAPFRMGTLKFTLAADESALTLTLVADDRRLSIAQDGVATQDGQWVIQPGQAEEDIPARAIAMELTKALAAAVANSVEAPTIRYDQWQAAGQAVCYNAQGKQSFIDRGITTVTDSFAWGEGNAARGLVSPPSSFAAHLSCGPEDTAHMPGDIAEAMLWKTHDLMALNNDDTYAYAFDDRPGLIVLSGFLGSGKTTFLNQLLEYHASRDELVAIIQNEVGQTGVDGKLLEGDESIVELDEGCVCCTLAGSISRGVEQLRARFNPKVIVLETTGLANPFNILGELDKLRPLARLDSITTLVDAANALDLLSESDIARNQIEAADIVLLNKCDLVSEDHLETLGKTLRSLNKRAALVQTEHGAVNPGILYDTDTLKQSIPGLLPSVPQKPHHDHTMEGYTSRRFAFSNPLSREDLIRTLKHLPPEVFRLKGIVGISDTNEAEVVQYVAGRYEFSRLGNDFDDDYFLVAIGRDMNLSTLENLAGAQS